MADLPPFRPWREPAKHADTLAAFLEAAALILFVAGLCAVAYGCRPG